MADLQDWYLGQIVAEGEMDTIYTDMNASERELADSGSLNQDTASLAHRFGGILEGLTVVKTPTFTNKVDIYGGFARDSTGRLILLAGAPTVVGATVLLTNLGDTVEGVVTDAVGNGALVASSISAGEAWLSLFIAFDTNLSDVRQDALGNSINFRQAESFHFELYVGTDAAVGTATDRPNLATTRVLLADILLDNSGDIRVITAVDAICNSSWDMNKIGYGPDDVPNLYGRRSDWLAIDPDGTDYDLLRNALDTSQPNNKAYYNIRANSPREAVKQLVELVAVQGTASKAGGSEVVGGRAVTKALATSGGNTKVDLVAGSVHDQLDALAEKINRKLSRGGDDTLTGNLVITGDLTVQTNLQVDGVSVFNDNATFNKELIVTSANGQDGMKLTSTGSGFDGKYSALMQSNSQAIADLFKLHKPGTFALTNLLYDDFLYAGVLAGPPSTDITKHAGLHWQGGTNCTYANVALPTAVNKAGGGLQMSPINPNPGSVWGLGAWAFANKGTSMLFSFVVNTLPATVNDFIKIGFADSLSFNLYALIKINSAGQVWGEIRTFGGITPAAPGVNLITGIAINTLYTVRITLTDTDKARFEGPDGNELVTDGFAGFWSFADRAAPLIWIDSPDATGVEAIIHRVIVVDQELTDL